LNSEQERSVALRPAVFEDAHGITLALLESAEHHARLDPERYFVPAFDTLFTRYQNRIRELRSGTSSEIMLVAEQNGEIVGFIEAKLEQSPDPMHRSMTFCHVGEIVVRGQHRSQGIGAQLVRGVEDWGREHGADFVSLEYHIANTRAASFYQRKMGYGPAAVTAIKRL
jgi:ribosomal protein S18 acetylase RimI-like enzyme